MYQQIVVYFLSHSSDLLKNFVYICAERFIRCQQGVIGVNQRILAMIITCSKVGVTLQFIAFTTYK